MLIAYGLCEEVVRMNESKSFLNFEKQMCSENTVDSVQVVSS